MQIGSCSARPPVERMRDLSWVKRVFGYQGKVLGISIDEPEELVEDTCLVIGIGRERKDGAADRIYVARMC